MRYRSRRHFLRGTAGVAAAIAGCFQESRAAGFTHTAVEAQELVVEFDEALDPDAISVIDPDGEGYAETPVSAGVTKVTFQISMPYTPGEYTVVATTEGDEIAEANQEIVPDLEIFDVSVGANKMDEMPEDLHFADRQVIIKAENQGNGPEKVRKLSFSEEFPNPSEGDGGGSGIFSAESGLESSEGAIIEAGKTRMLYSTNMPFADLEQKCDNEGITTEGTVRFDLEMSGASTTDVEIRYSGTTSSDECEVELQLL